MKGRDQYVERYKDIDRSSRCKFHLDSGGGQPGIPICRLSAGLLYGRRSPRWNPLESHKFYFRITRQNISLYPWGILSKSLGALKFSNATFLAIAILLFIYQPLPSINQLGHRPVNFTGVVITSPVPGAPGGNLPARFESLVAPGNSSIPVANFDEQLGMTFTQNFSVLSYNVTAVKQQDLNGFGPAYLLNGLSNLGYWYQVGISWDWPFLGGGHSSGFGFNFEVFSFNGLLIFPQNAGGLVNFSGSVNPGDNVGLSLMFNGANVTMQAVDWETSAVANIGYSAFWSESIRRLSAFYFEPERIFHRTNDRAVSRRPVQRKRAEGHLFRFERFLRVDVGRRIQRKHQ